MLKILITGCNGQVGWELMRTLAPLGSIYATDTHNMNLANPDAIRQTIKEYKPNVIVNAAAYTAVDLAETHAEQAMTINCEACGILAEEAKKIKALLIHYSTDYVFDGAAIQRPYHEDDNPSPINVYGVSKLAGEKAIQLTGGAYYIFRTSWVYGVRGKNFLHTMLKLAKERSQLKIVNDQYGAPTWSRLIAEATALIIAKSFHTSAIIPYGVYHMTCAGTTNWYEFACTIFEIYEELIKENAKVEFKQPHVLPIPTTEYPVPAKRPQYGVLDNTKLRQSFGIALPNWKEALVMCINDLLNN